MTWKKVTLWSAWGLSSLMLAAFLGYSLTKGDRGIFLIGETTRAHHQIEMACEACHVPFGGMAALQDSCVRCHGEDLKAANDTHPKSKFTDPRNADRVAVLDARLCVTCHREHRPEITRAMAVTLPDDYCFKCHRDVAKERPSHTGLPFDSCATAGCHNFHDNRALYEEFIAKHLDEPAIRAKPAVLIRAMFPASAGTNGVATSPSAKSLSSAAADGPGGHAVDAKVLHEWSTTAHARAGVNCTGCHRPKGADGRSQAWTDRLDHAACATCHGAEAKGFLEGKHGMRLAQKLPAMTPATARVPVKADASDKTLGCTTCHGAHAFDTRKAAVEVCEGCHDDKHTRAYRASPHFTLWQAEGAGAAPPGSGVSCATCHLPRETHKREEDGHVVTRVQHNQNRNLRPNDKMIRSACLACHGLGFSVDALADRALVEANFKGKPGRVVESHAWVKRRLEIIAQKKARSERKP